MSGELTPQPEPTVVGKCCSVCTVARSALRILMFEITKNASLDLVAQSTDGATLPFRKIWVACDACGDTGVSQATSPATSPATVEPDVYPSSVSVSRLDNPPSESVFTKKDKSKPK